MEYLVRIAVPDYLVAVAEGNSASMLSGALGEASAKQLVAESHAILLCSSCR